MKATTSNAEQLLFDRRQAAAMLGVSPGTVDNLRLRGELPSLKLGAARRYDRRDLLALIDRLKPASAGGSA